MKGQVSIEYLLITLIGLAMLSFSLQALGVAVKGEEVGYGKALFLSDAYDIRNTAEEVCILGDGNSRIIFIHSGSITVEGGKEGKIYNKFGSLEYELPCEMEGVTLKNGKAIIENNQGVISVVQ